MAERTILRIRPLGRLANHMIQYMFCLEVQRACRQPVDIEGYDMPDWSLRSGLSEVPDGNLTLGAVLTRRRLLCRMIDKFKPPILNLHGIVMCMASYVDAATYASLFPPSEPRSPIADDTLLVHVRAGDVAKLSHPLYGPIPISYYRHLAEFTGLKMAFIGELDDSPYVRELRAVFPASTFYCGGSVIDDFQTLRSAAHVALAVSSFSWLAALISERAQVIHLPLAGMFDPINDPGSDMIPRKDRRYVVHKIERRVWSSRYADFKAEHATYRLAKSSDLAALRVVSAVRSAPASARIHLGLLRRMSRAPNSTMH